MFYLRLATAVLGFVAASLYGVFITLVRRDRSRVASDYAHLLARLMRRPLGLDVQVSGEAHLHAQRPAIFIANHQSMLDVPILASLHPPDAVVVAKKELRTVPFFGWIYAATGNIFIDRSQRVGAVERLKAVEEEIVRRRVAVWIFPEGTRGLETGRLLPFKKGAFQMAIATGAPLVPVVISPLKPASDLRGRRLRRQRVDVRVLAPIPTAGLTPADLPTLLLLAQTRMQDTLEALAR